MFQVVFLNVCLCLPYVVFFRYRAAIAYLVQRTGRSGEVSWPDFGDSINVPRLYPILHAMFLLSLFFPRSLFPTAVASGALGLALVVHLFDPLSGLVLFAFLAVAYVLFRVPWISRAGRLAGVLVLYWLFMNACQFLDKLPGWATWPLSGEAHIVQLARFGPGFIPLLWYGTYEICAGRLGYLQFNVYLFMRFLDTPVFHPRDLRIEWDERRRWQWRGLLTLGTAFVAIACRWLFDRYLTAQGPDWHMSSGVRLLWLCYCYYLSLCCALVGAFNLFVGWARMFGIPIKDVFHFWLLARTPNERWQRWNILFREWIITYVFYPMMRAKRGLFLSIMATLLVSGALHLFGSLTPDRFDIERAGRIMTYWALNGLAIYVVILGPRRFPDLMDRLRVREHVAWSMLGMVVTSSYYSTLFVLRDKCMTPMDWYRFIGRLVGI